MRDLRLPKLDKNRHINQQKVLVFDSDNVKYDIILGTNFLSKTGIKLNYSVVGHLELYRTHVLSYSTYVLLYHTMVLMARLTKVRR